MLFPREPHHRRAMVLALVIALAPALALGQEQIPTGVNDGPGFSPLATEGEEEDLGGLGAEGTTTDEYGPPPESFDAPEADSEDFFEEAAAEEQATEKPGEATSPPGGPGTKTFDVMVTRPLGFLALIVGFTFFSISAPVVVVTPALNVPTTWDLFVLSRWDYTFVRPVGEL